MDEHHVSALEAAVADLGTLLMQVERYRAGTAPDGLALRREVLDLGDRARRLLRRDALTPAAAEELLETTRSLAARLRALHAAVTQGALYGEARRAFAAGDHQRLAQLLPEIFSGLAALAPPARLYHPLAVTRRGKPVAIAVAIERARTLLAEGLPAGGDDLTAGRDDTLQAVVFTHDPPRGESVALACDGVALGNATILQLVDTEEYLIYAPIVRLPFTIVFPPLAPDDEPEHAFDPSFRAALAAAFAAAGLTVTLPPS